MNDSRKQLRFRQGRDRCEQALSAIDHELPWSAEGSGSSVLSLPIAAKTVLIEITLYVLVVTTKRFSAYWIMRCPALECRGSGSSLS